MKLIIKNDNRDIVKNPNIKIIETTEASFTNQTVILESNDVPVIKYTDTESTYFIKNLDNLYDRKSKSEILLNITIDNLELINNTEVGPQGPQGVEGPQGPQGALGPVGPAGLEWQGLWDKDTSYAQDDAVGYAGASWFCILAVTGTSNDSPDNDTEHWALLAAQGAQGQTGATGAQGPQGPGATQTLQQTVNLGNTIDDGEGTILNITSSQVKIQDALGGKINIEYATGTGNKPTIEFGIPSSGGLKTLLQTPDTQTGNRIIKLPDASGTIALQTYKSYVAQIIPDSSSAITTNVLENTLGTTVALSWVSGKLRVTLGSSIMTTTNFYLNTSSYFGGSNYYITTPTPVSFSAIDIDSYKVNGTPAQGWAFGSRIYFEIRIYR